MCVRLNVCVGCKVSVCVVCDLSCDVAWVDVCWCVLCLCVMLHGLNSFCVCAVFVCDCVLLLLRVSCL